MCPSAVASWRLTTSLLSMTPLFSISSPPTPSSVTVFSTAPGTRGIHPSEHVPTAPLPRSTALPTMLPPTVTARYSLIICFHGNFTSHLYSTLLKIHVLCLLSLFVLISSVSPSNIHVYMSSHSSTHGGPTRCPSQLITMVTSAE